jgi:hypothetical protein
MQALKSTISLIAVGMGLLVGNAVHAAIAPFELEDIEYSAGVNTIIGSFQTNAAGTLVTGFTISQAVLETYDNTGQPNWASEALLGFTVALPDESGIVFYTIPFENIQEYGVFGPLDISVDLSGYGLYVPADGIITAYAISSWTDGTDLPAGIWTQGELNVNYLPAPGSLALLLLAGIATRRRQRQ